LNESSEDILRGERRERKKEQKKERKKEQTKNGGKIECKLIET
jgi:hypothetical protein